VNSAATGSRILSARLAALDPLLAQLPPLSPPEDHCRFPIPPGIFYALFGIGFIGHLVRSTTLVFTGVLMVFAATGVFVVLSLHVG
jgi:hypothetical protein